MGNTCKPMAVLFQCMTKFTTNKKKKIKNKKKNKKKEDSGLNQLPLIPCPPFYPYSLVLKYLSNTEMYIAELRSSCLPLKN